MHSGVLDGWLTRNEARAMEGFDPIDGLDEPLVPVNERDLNDARRFLLVLMGAIGKRLTYRRLAAIGDRQRGIFIRQCSEPLHRKPVLSFLTLGLFTAGTFRPCPLSAHPQLPVEASVLDSLGDVGGGKALLAVQIGHGAPTAPQCGLHCPIQGDALLRPSDALRPCFPSDCHRLPHRSVRRMYHGAAC